jgi:hypothetical protein
MRYAETTCAAAASIHYRSRCMMQANFDGLQASDSGGDASLRNWFSDIVDHNT